MVAAHQPRLCRECGGDISHMRWSAQRHTHCAQLYKRRLITERRRREREEYRSLRKMQVYVTSARTEEKRVPNVVCSTCAGIPDARTPLRYDERGREIGPEWECIECGEPYEDPPEIRAEASYRSSAVVAVEHGHLYGMEKLDGCMRALHGKGPVVRKCKGYETRYGHTPCALNQKIRGGRSRCPTCSVEQEEHRKMKRAREVYAMKKGANDGEV